MSAPSTDAVSADPPFPRLQISDLLVLTLTAAFGMTWIGALGDGDPPSDTSDWAARLGAAARNAFNGLLIGVELFGLAVVIRELVRGRSLRSFAPGHWWFLVAAPLHVLEGAQYLIAIWGIWQFNYVGQWRTVESAANVPIYLVFVAAWLWATAHMKTTRWGAIFAIKALEQSVWLLFYVLRSARYANLAWTPTIRSMHFFGVTGTLHVFQLAVLLFALARDKRLRVKRDWLHYLGAAVIVAESLNFYHDFGHLSVQWWSALWSLLTA